MDITSTTLILVGGICIVLGFFASILLNTLKDEYEPEQLDDPKPPGGLKGKYVPVTRLWRDRKTGNLVVEVEGKSLVGSQPLSEAQRFELEQAARDFRSWLGMGLAASQQSYAGPSAPQNQTSEMTKPEENFVPVMQTAGPTPETAKSQANVIASQTVRVVKPAKPVAVVDPAPVNKSIVMQIEDILQDMISGGPHENRIHLSEDPVHGVIVHVGDQQFEGIDSVSDPEIKAILRSAVAAWEKM